MFDKYEVELTLLRDQLGTNPCDPNVMDTHIIDRQRKLIMERSQINSTINKYLDQIPISKERGEEEVEMIFAKLEKLTGYTFSPEEKTNALTGNLKALKETFSELDVKGTTVFFWDKEKDKPMIGDHMVYGFMKAAAEAISRTRPTKRATVLQSASYTQSLINQHVRCEEQFITFDHDVKKKEDGSPSYLQRSLRAMTAQGPRVTLAKSEVVEKGAKLKFNLKVMKGSPIKKEHIEEIFAYGECVGLGQWRAAGNGMFKTEIKDLN